MYLSFVDDLEWIVTGSTITETTNGLKRCALLSKEWATKNAVEFDVEKTEAILFGKRKKNTKMKINIGDNVKIPYNKGATRWLGFWLDSALNFKDHYTKRMAKA